MPVKVALQVLGITGVHVQAAIVLGVIPAVLGEALAFHANSQQRWVANPDLEELPPSSHVCHEGTGALAACACNIAARFPTALGHKWRVVDGLARDVLPANQNGRVVRAGAQVFDVEVMVAQGVNSQTALGNRRDLGCGPEAKMEVLTVPKDLLLLLVAIRHGRLGPLRAPHGMQPGLGWVRRTVFKPYGGLWLAG